MKKLILACLLIMTYSKSSFANQTWVASASIRVVLTGYASGEILLITNSAAQNPASCTSSDAYIIPPEYNTRDMLHLLITAKANNRAVSFSVRNDNCRAIQDRNQSDITDATFPVIQRVAMQ